MQGKEHNDVYTATGFGGQFITVFPKERIVVAHKTKLGRLVEWGLTAGGTRDGTYWKILDKVISAENQ